MKLPEPLFKFINIVVRSILKSPAHGLFSSSLTVIGFRGRLTGKCYETPVRYVEVDGRIQCFTSKSGKWWRSVGAAAQVTLLVQRKRLVYQPEVVIDDTERVAIALQRCLSLFPQDAAYHNIEILGCGEPDPTDFARALSNVVLIELTRLPCT